jgi:CheY-like chemotaxis protein
MNALKILIVEDIYFNLVLVESIVNDLGHSLLKATNGAEALKIMANEKPQLIILDLMMPVMNGYEFLEEKKKLRDKTPVLILTAKSDAKSIEDAMSLGANDFLLKPINSNDLRKKIELLLP